MNRLAHIPPLNHTDENLRASFVAGVNAALELLAQHLRLDTQVFTGIVRDTATSYTFKSLDAMLRSPSHAKPGPLGDTFFTEPFFSARLTLQKLLTVKEQLLTLEELCQHNASKTLPTG